MSGWGAGGRSLGGRGAEIARVRSKLRRLATSERAVVAGGRANLWKVGRVRSGEYEFGIEISRWQPSV